MQDILVRAGCFVAIILLGYFLRKINFMDETAFPVLSKIVIKITLPAAIVVSFNGKEIDSSLLFLVAIGLGCCVLYMILGYVLNIRGGKDKQAFAIINMSGYNIGNFTMPFVQSFLGPIGVITTSLFDTGNALICLGTSYSIASIIKEGGRFSFVKIGKKLVQSVPLLCYVIMVVLCLLHIFLPGPVISFAEIIADGNAFLAMFMIGVGFKLDANKDQIGQIAKIIIFRYGVAIVAALIFYFVLPFELGVRQALVILAFAPISSASPAFTGEMHGDVGLASAVNSVSIVLSITIIVGLLLIML
ncbi:AEC family transporter [Frisingicoccus sp.]|uniref:AEC family transporter n=1 Tax=Frisingicoccus sp. TaxID=1918627 RepID=UPI00386BBA1B